jgi:hypothetical protein
MLYTEFVMPILKYLRVRLDHGSGFDHGRRPNGLLWTCLEMRELARHNFEF